MWPEGTVMCGRCGHLHSEGKFCDCRDSNELNYVPPRKGEFTVTIDIPGHSIRTLIVDEGTKVVIEQP